MTPHIAALITIAAAILAIALLWAINKVAERRIRHIVSTALARPDDGHTAVLIRSRQLDDEYRALVLAEHNKTDD